MNLTINMAHQWGPQIRVNCIAPGVISTPRSGEASRDLKEVAERIAVGRPGTADEIGAVALFLASDGASFINGAIIDVHGGK
jgi:3-oxoacyl-[acyl-carrier protein] reductase